MTSSNGNIFRFTGHYLCEEFTGHRWIPLTKASDGWVNNREAADLWRHRAHYDVTVMHVVKLSERSQTKRICTHTVAMRDIFPKQLVD